MKNVTPIKERRDKLLKNLSTKKKADLAARRAKDFLSDSVSEAEKNGGVLSGKTDKDGKIIISDEDIQHD